MNILNCGSYVHGGKDVPNESVSNYRYFVSFRFFLDFLNTSVSVRDKSSKVPREDCVTWTVEVDDGR